MSASDRGGRAWRRRIVLFFWVPFLVLGGAIVLGQVGPTHLPAIRTEAEFVALSVPSGPDGEVERTTKYLVPASDDPGLLEPLFQNVNRYPLHQEFLREVFPDRFGDLTVEQYLALVERRETREYFAGSLSRRRTELGVIFGFTVFTVPGSPEELPEVDEARRVHAELSAIFGIAGALYYAPDTPDARAAAREWDDPGFPVFTGGAPRGSYEAYTRGVGYGTVRLLTLEEFNEANGSGRITWQDVLVLERAPSDIESVVSGVVTSEPQEVLSHVAIRTARRGTPNAYLEGAFGAFGPLEGRLVRLEVRATEYEVREVPLEEAMAWWEESRPRVSGTPRVDGDYSRFDALEEMDLSGTEFPPESRYGGKAANLARLQRILDGPLERYREPGFVIPVHYYLDFLRSNRMPSFVDPDRFVTYEDYLEELFSSEEFQSNPVLRFDVLKHLREHMREHGRVDLELVVNLALRVQEVFGETRDRVRFRSSSNVEDLLEFNGAGLYESTSACAADDLDTNERGPSRCDSTRPDERGIGRALKKVWASLWTSRAYEERTYFGIPQESAAMAVLVTRAFVDERANGVAFTGNPSNLLDRRYVVTAQLGEESVVTPRPGVLAERNLLHVDERGEVVLIERRRPSSLVSEGERVLEDGVLRELGSLLWRVEQEMEVDRGDHGREEVLFDVEFKVEAEGDLAVKQVRPFLVTQPPPEGPVFALEVPEGTVLCGIFAEGRDAVSEYGVKSELRLRQGRHELPTVVDTFTGSLVEEFVFGPERERLEPPGTGLFRVRTETDGSGNATYTFTYEEEFSLPGGEVLALSLDFLDFEVRAGEPPETERAVGGGFGGEGDGLFLTAIPAGDRERVVRFLSCAYEELPRWDVRAELVDGTSLRLEERYRPQIAGTAPAALVAAEVDIAGVRREVRDYWRLVYAAEHHNVNRRYLVVLDPPVGVPGTGSVRAVELSEPRFLGGEPAGAVFRGRDLEVLSRPGVVSFERCAGRCLTEFRRGDADSSGRVNLTDAIFVLNGLFRDGPATSCADAADFNDDGEVEITDAILILFYLFRGVDLSEPPGPLECGADPSADSLAQCRDVSCS